MYDAQDKETDLKELILYYADMGHPCKEGLDVFEKVEDAINADMKETRILLETE